MSSGIIETIKRIALNAFEATKPVNLLFGEVISTDPVTIKVGELLTLGREFLVINGTVSKGDMVTLIRCQGGQKYVVLGTRTGYVQNTVYVGGGETVPDSGGVSTGTWQYPYKNGYTKTSDFGWRRSTDSYHKGVDLVGSSSKHIYPVDSGTVVWVKRLSSGYGNHLLVNHGNGVWSLYAHLGDIYVKQGQKVNKNTILGVEGSTGNSTGSHLHLEIRKSESGGQVDPVAFLTN